MTTKKILVLIGVATLVASSAWATKEAGNTRFSNTGGISNTRHNLSQSTISTADQMDAYRNDYGEVCVYCHTPHGANPNIDAPLWNRTYKANTYNTYNQLGTSSLTQTVTAPGVNSMTCLSCHDGTIAVDSIINMPGSGQYNAARATQAADTPFDASLLSGANAFVVTNASTQWSAGDHFSMNAGTGVGDKSCLVCHSDPGFSSSAQDFSSYVIGQDLTNDHPIGIRLPAARLGDDFQNATLTTSGSLTFYDSNADGRADTNEVRFYDTGQGPEVECASCHDPHGVDDGGTLIGRFLRVDNSNASALCQTCHAK